MVKINKTKVLDIGREGDFLSKFQSFDFKEPNFDEMFVERPDVKIGEVGLFEKDSNEAAKKIVEKVKEINSFEADKIREAKQRVAKTEADYYFNVVFVSGEACREFLEKSGLAAWGDERLIDGHKLAEVLGISLENKPTTVMKLFRRNSKF